VNPRQPEQVADGSLHGAAEAISAGFEDNEIWVWMVPHAPLLRRGLRAYYRRTLRHIFMPMGASWVSADRMGAAAWVPPGRWRFNKREQQAELRGMLPWLIGGLGKGQRIERLMHAHHPEEPHWYLHTLSIHPDRQRQGYGSSLIAPGLDRADAEGLPCYLETQRESNIPFYARFGFELQEEISLPDSPPLWTMWRP
jgi:ribosomal protein S18 acetylase RimI-like enzyme